MSQMRSDSYSSRVDSARNSSDSNVTGCRDYDVMWVGERGCCNLSPDIKKRFHAFRTGLSLGGSETIFREGDQADYIYMVISGSLKLYKLLSNGRRQVVRFLFVGDMFGLDRTTAGLHSTSAESLAQTHLCRLPLYKIEQLGEEIPRLNVYFKDILVQDIISAQNHLLLLGRKSADEKLASFFLDMSQKSVMRGLVASPIFLTMSRMDIADYLGLTIETVSRTITRLRQRDIISLPLSGQVVLNDLQKLQEIADE